MKHMFSIPDISNNVYYNQNPEYFLALKNLVENHIKGFQQSLNSYCSRKEYTDYSELRAWIIKSLPLLRDPIYKWNTKCYWILFGLIDFPKCEKCGKYIGIGKNIKITKGYCRFCSAKCAGNSDSTKNARVLTTQKKYGVDNINQLDSIKQKKREYFLKTYGVSCNFQIAEVQAKIKSDNLLKYGVEFYQSTDEYLQKVQSTLFSRYGVTNLMQSEEFRLKCIQANILKYGVEYSFQSEAVKQKIIESCLQKYGVRHYMQVHEIMQKTHRHYTFENITFDSAPELAFFIFLRDHNIEFQYQPADDKFTYEFQGKLHRYYPDFKVNNQYIELKGDQFVDKNTGKWIYPYDRSKDDLYEAKHQFILANNVIIIYTNGYIKYLDYVNAVYGKNYINQFKNSNIKKGQI